MHAQIKVLKNRTSPSNGAYAIISNEFKDGRCEAKEQRKQQRDRDTLAPNVPEINSNFCFFRPGPSACPDPCCGTKST